MVKDILPLFAPKQLTFVIIALLITGFELIVTLIDESIMQSSPLKDIERE